MKLSREKVNIVLARNRMSVTQLAEAARNDGITLKDSVIGNLRNATHNEHIVPIVNIGKDGKWDAGLIQQRSERICEILWERVKAWLEA